MITDVNVNLSRWPFRRLAGDEPAALVAKLRKMNVAQAWAGTFDGVFHKDIAVSQRPSGERLQHLWIRTPGPVWLGQSEAPELAGRSTTLPGRAQDAGIRLQPNYHGYKLEDPEFRKLLNLAAARKLVVQLALCMDDERTQHPLMRVPPVDCTPLADVIRGEPQLRLVILNAYPQLRIETLRPLSFGRSGLV